jgi:hypothetical protein
MILRRGLVRARPGALCCGRPSARALGNMVQDFAKRTLLENAASFSNGDPSVFGRPVADLQAQAISTGMSVDSATWKSIVVRGRRARATVCGGAAGRCRRAPRWRQLPPNLSARSMPSPTRPPTPRRTRPL